jgi:hypothetical protein
MGHAGLSELMSADFEQQLLASNVSSMDAQSFLEIYFKALEKNAPLVPHMAASELIRLAILAFLAIFNRRITFSASRCFQ